MHRGKVHDSGGDASFASVRTVEIYNKLEDHHGDLNLPRVRTMVPFIKKNGTDELNDGDTVDFKIEKVDAITSTGLKIPTIIAFEVDKVDHSWFGHRSYLLKCIKAVLAGTVAILAIGIIFNLFGLQEANEEKSLWQNLLLNAPMALWQCLFIGLILVFWSGTRTTVGGMKTGLKLGIFIAIFIALFDPKYEWFEEPTVMVLTGLEYLIKYIAAGAAIGWVVQSRVGEFEGIGS